MKKKILLADDEPGILRTLKILLEDMEYEVTTAPNAEEALKILAENSFPVLMTDIKMPGMDGIALLKTVKEKYPDTEVIMMTGHGDLDLAIESLKYEAADFISKPVRDDAVEIALQRAFEKISVRQQLREYTENLEKIVEEKSRKLVEAERLLAVNQAFEGITSAIMGFAGDLDGDLQHFNDLPFLVSLHDRDMAILAANQMYKERLGEGKGRKSWEIYTGDASSPCQCPVAQTFHFDKAMRSKEIVKVDGERIPLIVYTVPIRDRDGNTELVIEIASEISEVKRLQDELQYERERYRQLFDEVPCYISVQDRSLKIVEINRLFREDFGDHAGRYCYKAYKGREKTCKDCPVMETFADGKPHSSEAVVESAKGEQYNVLIWTAPIRDRDGKIVQVMEMSTNITQIYKLRDQLSSLGLLIGSISHGIKGMLTGLDGGVYMLNSGFKKDKREQMEEGWEIVKLMISRIREMILNILYYAKERELSWEQVDVAEFINEIAATFEPKARKEKIDFIRDFAPGLGGFEIDPMVSRAALINILENAVDACKEDLRKKEHSITFRAKRENENIIFEISDNGPGMDKETLNSLFTLFFSSKGNRGTGLGLFVSKKTVEQHGGRISVASEPGKGSTFRIQMPVTLSESLRGKQEGSH
ncbi:MAG: response regulator [Desulfococcaceae bacterium]|jgi:PAS domain S-box-containing protein|nr:response regulator [Desulfococcaceae bacterium]